MEKLDAICMQLVAIGESVKNLDKATTGSLLPDYPEIEWKRVMGLRDILSHHYFDIDAEIVYGVCAEHIPKLAESVRRMLDELSELGQQVMRGACSGNDGLGASLIRTFQGDAETAQPSRPSYPRGQRLHAAIATSH